MATTSVSASISLTASGKITKYGTLSWIAPSLPEGAIISDISVLGTYDWNGKGNVTVCINGDSVYSGSSFDVSLGASVASPYQISCRGGNKNATGSNFSWGTLQVTYTYTVQSSGDVLYTNINNTQTEISYTKVYKNVNGSWVEQTDLTTVFDNNTNYKI